MQHDNQLLSMCSSRALHVMHMQHPCTCRRSFASTLLRLACALLCLAFAFACGCTLSQLQLMCCLTKADR
jgi:hypothetical protein